VCNSPPALPTRLRPKDCELHGDAGISVNQKPGVKERQAAPTFSLQGDLVTLPSRAAVGLLLGGSEELDLVGQPIGGVDRLTVLLVGGFLKIALDEDEVANLALCLDPVGLLGEDGDGVPAGVLLPITLLVLPGLPRTDVRLEGLAQASDLGDTADQEEGSFVVGHCRLSFLGCAPLR
jgi:hypothetical protein